MVQNIDPVISDMFFHMDHSERSYLLSKSARENVDLDKNLEREAILKDAHQFSTWLKHLGHEVDPESLMINFFMRL